MDRLGNSLQDESFTASELESLVEMFASWRTRGPPLARLPSLSVTLAGDPVPNTQGKLIMGSAHPRLWNPI